MRWRVGRPYALPGADDSRRNREDQAGENPENDACDFCEHQAGLSPTGSGGLGRFTLRATGASDCGGAFWWVKLRWRPVGGGGGHGTRGTVVGIFGKTSRRRGSLFPNASQATKITMSHSRRVMVGCRSCSPRRA